MGYRGSLFNKRKSYFCHSSSMQSGWHCDTLLLFTLCLFTCVPCFKHPEQLFKIQNELAEECSYRPYHVFMCSLACDSHTLTAVMLYHFDLCWYENLWFLPWMSDIVATRGLKAWAIRRPECDWHLTGKLSVLGLSHLYCRHIANVTKSKVPIELELHQSVD